MLLVSPKNLNTDLEPASRTCFLHQYYPHHVFAAQLLQDSKLETAFAALRPTRFHLV